MLSVIAEERPTVRITCVEDLLFDERTMRLIHVVKEMWR